MDLDHAAIRRPGTDGSLITYGGSPAKALAAADEPAAEGISAEVSERSRVRIEDEDTPRLTTLSAGADFLLAHTQ